ncbi:MAG: hypothetical protein ACTSP4_00855 [Candidatus Hodarchaeales archaeon]
MTEHKIREFKAMKQGFLNGIQEINSEIWEDKEALIDRLRDVFKSEMTKTIKFCEELLKTKK